MSFFKEYLKQNVRAILYFFLFSIIFLISFVLYHLPIKAVLYPIFMCALLGIFFFISGFRQAYNRHGRLMEIQKLSAELIGDLPEPHNTDDLDYQEIIRLLCEQQMQLASQMNDKYSDMTEYYTIWAHQIKTPIASMKLQLQNEDTALARSLSSELFRIEQYVEMVMTFLRLDSDSTDYTFKECDLDLIIRQAVKNFSGEFITRKLKLEYEPLNTTVITDEKWLTFVIEQLLSNALKYTPKGAITIKLEAPKTLCICDTGMGIAPEDLPRIFEKGYTGYNGRYNKKASGIGLYLCKRILAKLGHSISVCSKAGEGTIMRIDLEQKSIT